MAPDRVVLLERLAASPSRVAAAARRVAEVDAAAGGPPEGEWTAREAVGHLVSVEIAVWHARLDSLDAGGTPAWSWTEPGPATGPETATLDAAIARFAELRASTVARITALDEAGWARAGVHATYGRLDVAAMLGVLIDHDDEHLAGLEGRARG